MIDCLWSIPRLSGPFCHLGGKINAMGKFFSVLSCSEMPQLSKRVQLVEGFLIMLSLCVYNDLYVYHTQIRAHRNYDSKMNSTTNRQWLRYGRHNSYQVYGSNSVSSVKFFFQLVVTFICDGQQFWRSQQSDRFQYQRLIVRIQSSANFFNC